MKRLPSLVLAALALAAVAVPALAATKRKPLGYSYSQCTTKTSCSFTGITSVTGSTISITDSKLCRTAGSAFEQVGSLKVSGGKFSKTVTKTVADVTTQLQVPVKIKIKGTLKAHKSVKGQLTVTTTAADCASVTGKAKTFSMKYRGPVYGG